MARNIRTLKSEISRITVKESLTMDYVYNNLSFISEEYGLNLTKEEKEKLLRELKGNKVNKSFKKPSPNNSPKLT